VTARDGGLPPELDGRLALSRHGMSGRGMPTTFLLGGSPERPVAVGDLNGDGHAARRGVALADAGQVV